MLDRRPLLFAVPALVLTRPAGAQIFLSREAEARLGAQEHPKILAQFGGAMEGPHAAYVRELGQKLAALSDRPGDSWTFTLLNTTVINAFAVPGGYIYVTRALMSLCADEAELAAVIGHEIGHVIHRHAAQRYDRQVGAQIGGVAAEILGQVFLGVRGAGQIASLAGQFWLAAYSREQEFEADTYGVRLLRAAGYTTEAMASFLDRMNAWDRLDAAATGRRPGEDQFSWLSTHPRTTDRVRAAIAQAGGDARGRTARDEHIRRLDGLVWGDDVNEGVVRGRTFLHPGLLIRLDFPEGYRVVNGKNAVSATHREGAQIVFDAARIRGDLAPDQYLTRVWAQNVRLGGVSALEVAGWPAAAARGRLATREGTIDLLLVAAKFAPGRYWRFQLATRADRLEAFEAGFNAMLASFRRISREEAAAIRPLKLRAHQVRAGETVASLARTLPLPQPEQRLRVLNGLGADETLRPGMWVKLIAA